MGRHQAGMRAKVHAGATGEADEAHGEVVEAVVGGAAADADHGRVGKLALENGEDLAVKGAHGLVEKDRARPVQQHARRTRRCCSSTLSSFSQRFSRSRAGVR